MTDTFNEYIIPLRTLSDLFSGAFNAMGDTELSPLQSENTGQVLIHPRIIGAILEGVTYRETGGDEGGSPDSQVAATFVVAASDSKDTTRADYVCDGTADEVQIQEAIDALPTVGGRVHLLEGTYTLAAAVVLPNNSMLTGNGSGTTLKLKDSAGNINMVENEDATNGNSGITVRDIRFNGNKANNNGSTNYGIKFTKVGFLTAGNDVYGAFISNCIFHDIETYSIYLINNQKSTVISNHITDSDNDGIHLSGTSDGSKYNIIANNVIKDCGRYGIVLFSSENIYNLVQGNQCYNNTNSGIAVGNSSKNTITGNVCDNNGGKGIESSQLSNSMIVGNWCSNNTSDGIKQNGGPCTIQGNTCSSNGGKGIYVLSSVNSTITGNRCTGNTGIGIDITTSNNSVITGNTSYNDGVIGIFISTSANCAITGNLCDAATEGISLANSSYCSITGNHCESNSSIGIRVSSSSNGAAISGNSCKLNTDYGIFVMGSINCAISGNTLFDNDYGILLTSVADYCIVSNNTFANNDKHGILLDGADHNTISNNNIFNNNQDSGNFDGISVDNDSNENNIQGNTIRDGGEQRYGIHIANANCDDNLVTNNDLKGSGQTANLQDDGTGTITTAGNRT